MGNYRKLWFALIGVMIVCFSLLGYYGVEVYRTAPPIPQTVQTEDGRVLYTDYVYAFELASLVLLVDNYQNCHYKIHHLLVLKMA